MKSFDEQDWLIRKDRFWSVFFNSISGPRSVVMIGTENNDGIGNLGLFNSLAHIGANPPLLGFILRPTTVERHTYDNIKSTGSYTINHATVEEIDRTHQTSAKYDSDVDEFTAIGFDKEYAQGVRAPFIASSAIKLGMEFVEEHLISANDTRLIVGRIVKVVLEEDLIADDGFVDTSAAKTLTVSGLDAYHEHKLVKRMPYARP